MGYNLGLPERKRALQNLQDWQFLGPAKEQGFVVICIMKRISKSIFRSLNYLFVIVYISFLAKVIIKNNNNQRENHWYFYHGNCWLDDHFVQNLRCFHSFVAVLFYHKNCLS